MEFQSEDIFSTCPDHPEIPFARLFDISKLNFQKLDNGSLNVLGSAEITYNFKPGTTVQVGVDPPRHTAKDREMRHCYLSKFMCYFFLV